MPTVARRYPAGPQTPGNRLGSLPGSSGRGTNPEQLFAAGYAACFHQALKLAAGQEKVDVSGSSVDAAVGIGPDDTSFALQVLLTVHTPGLDQVDRRQARRKGPPALPVLQGDPRQRPGPGQGRSLGPRRGVAPLA